ncbi:MAG: DegT/DnrJ/EryC1/StrS family aminotransferase [Planctomycetes bacterium]|nr:DegT/DnrJ/EryC1/StrS family aminotransferase [Planctomycetota bacterium]
MTKELAIHGGPKIIPDGIIKSWPPITQADRDAVRSVFDTDQLHTRSAPKAAELERRWAEYCGVEHCIVTNGGTQALHMALLGVGVEPGDEVILPAFSYWSSAAAIIHASAVPIFVDIDPRTFTIAPELIEPAITERTAAIMPVHIHGMPADLDPIIDIAARHGIPVVDDAAQAQGARYRGKVVGGLTDVTEFSLNRLKNLTGGEGGLVTTNSDAIYECAAATGGMGGVTVENGGKERTFFGHGYNYRPQEFPAALALSQLGRLDEYNARRREMADYLTERLEDIPGVAGPYTPDYADPVHFMYVIEFRPEELHIDISVEDLKTAAWRALEAEGVPILQWQRQIMPAMDFFQREEGYASTPPWRFGASTVTYDPSDYPVSEHFVNSHAYLRGVFPPNGMDLMELYVAAIMKVFAEPSKLLE